MTSHTAEYWFIELALAEHKRSFNALDEEMSAFRPLPLDSFDVKRREMWDQLRPHNADKPEEELRRFIDAQMEAGYSAEMQFNRRFLEPFAAEDVAITILSHTLCEATINAILAIGLSSLGKHGLFAVLESASLKDKWTIAPHAFLPNYTFPKSEALYESLSVLCKRRNSYVHSKITLRNADDKVLIDGSSGGSIAFDQLARNWLKRFLRLPYELHGHVCAQTEDESLRFHLSHLLSTR